MPADVNMPGLDTVSFENLAEYQAYSGSMAAEYARRQAAEAAILRNEAPFATGGFCFVCGSKSTFHTDYLYSDPGRVVAGLRIPNWRERLVCTVCGLNNRTRACIQFLESAMRPNAGDDIYITEQTTPLYVQLRGRYPRLIGSEYLGRRVAFGGTDKESGVRNESVTRLTFAGGRFDFILSFDVFEHVPGYAVALQECWRCLKHGGTLLFTVPFDKFAQRNLVRARVGRSGEIVHVLEPEYHGDPLNSEGCLCFYYFGWELLDRAREVGFSKVQAHFYWSEELAYLGGEQILFTAQK